MQNSKTIIVGYCVALFMMLMLLPVNAFSTAKLTNNWLDEPVTIRFKNEPLKKVLEKVSKQTGIAILYDQELANEKVSGNYKDVKASNAITRLFTGKNKSIQVSKDKKVIIVKTFGAKNFIWVGAVAEGPGNGQNSVESISLAELNKLTTRQYKEYKDRIANDNELLPEFGKTRGELRAMQVKQYKEYKERITKNNEFLPEVGMTRNELIIMQEQQYKEYQTRIADNNEILIGIGKIRGELNTMQELQYNEYKQRISREDELLPEFGMTRGELRAMHERQYKEYKNRQKTEARM